jgi:hypothetical protein
MNSHNSRFVFRKLDSIGSSAAEQDSAFLSDCFIETEDIKALKNVHNRRQIILGRTGAGKTALLLQFEKECDPRRIVNIPPENLALSHISNSNVLQFLLEVGVDLDIFFKLLWRHVLIVEILRMCYEIKSTEDQKGLIPRMLEKLTQFKSKDKKALEERRRSAIDYLEKWGHSFFLSTERRVKEITDQIESNVKGTLKGKLPKIVDVDAEAARKLTHSEKKEVIEHVQKVVNEVQVRELTEIVNMIEEELDDPQKPYFIIIDRLDEKWVDDSIRYALIRSLIETIRDFSRTVKHLKVIIALRTDLLETVIRETKQAGFQEEKYQDLYLPLTWSHSRLTELVDKRINHLVRQRYNSQKITHEMLFAKGIANKKPMDYMLERTLQRPRDIIAFINKCIMHAESKDKISGEIIKNAEYQYSQGRLSSLSDEWIETYPNLLKVVEILRNQKSIFVVSDIDKKCVDDFCLNIAIDVLKSDTLSKTAVAVAEAKAEHMVFLRECLAVFFKVGLVGLGLTKFTELQWSTDGRAIASLSDIEANTRVEIHPMFHKSLGIEPVKTPRGP